MRVFTAVDIENQRIQKELIDIRDEVDFSFNKVPAERMHVTLQFFQDVKYEEVEEIKKGLQKTSIQPFNAELKGLGVFPSKKRVRVVWAGVKSEEIFELKNQVSQHGVEEDNSHEFHPHITLARVNKIERTQKKKFREKLEQLESQKIGEIMVNSVKLFESRHTGKNTEYKVLEEKKL